MSVSKSSSSTKTSDSANSIIDDLDMFNIPSLIYADITNHKPQTLVPQNSKKMKENKKTCCVCAAPGFLSACLYPMCKSNFHSNCISSFFPELDSKSTCPAHSFKQLETHKKRLHMASHFNSSKHIQKIVKDDKDSKTHPGLKGKLFWYSINQQYFPYFSGHKPDLLPSKPEMPQQILEASWIESKIHKTQEKLSAVSTSLSSILNFVEIQPKFSSDLEKPGLSLLESGNLQYDLQEQLRVNSEILLSVPEKIELKDYHFNLAEDRIICAVCNDGESTYENLIVICSSCNLAVHCGCYNIQSIPEHDWHCDVCQASAFGANCVLCPVRGGAMKLAKPNKWVHVTCARYLLTSNLFTFNWDTRNIDRDKLRLSCVACGKRYGACVQCNYGRCSYAFHVECRKDLIEIEQDSVYWLCPQHKIKKIWRNVKSERELAQKFIDKVSEAFWKESMVQAKPAHEKVEKKEQLQRKVVMHVTPEAISMKFLVGGKVVQEFKYLNEMGNEPRKRKRDEETYFEVFDNDKNLNPPEEVLIEEAIRDVVKIDQVEAAEVEKEENVIEDYIKQIQETEKAAEIVEDRIIDTVMIQEPVVEEVKVLEERPKEPFLIFKSQKEKTSANVSKELVKPKRKYKKRKTKEPDAVLTDRNRDNSEDLKKEENLLNGFYSKEGTEAVELTKLYDEVENFIGDKIDDDIIDQFIYQEKEENLQNFSESKPGQVNITPEKKKRLKKEKGEKKERKEKESAEKKEKNDKSTKIPQDGKEKVRKPRKPRRVITAFPSEKGELWVKLLVPIEIYQRACRKKQKV